MIVMKMKVELLLNSLIILVVVQNLFVFIYINICLSCFMASLSVGMFMCLCVCVVCMCGVCVCVWCVCVGVFVCVCVCVVLVQTNIKPIGTFCHYTNVTKMQIIYNTIPACKFMFCLKYRFAIFIKLYRISWYKVQRMFWVVDRCVQCSGWQRECGVDRCVQCSGWQRECSEQVGNRDLRGAIRTSEGNWLSRDSVCSNCNGVIYMRFCCCRGGELKRPAHSQLD